MLTTKQSPGMWRSRERLSRSPPPTVFKHEHFDSEAPNRTMYEEHRL